MCIRDSGKLKSEETLSEQECLQIENRMLRAENKKQQMEIDFLKKLEEIELSLIHIFGSQCSKRLASLGK